MKKFTIPTYLVIALSIILFLILTSQNVYSFSYASALAFTLLLTFFLFSYGFIINKKENYKRNITIYILLYFFLLISLTIFMNRGGISFLDQDFLKQYTKTINLIPFKTILHYLTGPVNLSLKITNLLGNLFAFIPLSFLLMLKDKKYSSIKRQLLFVGITVSIIEVLQLVTATGRLDIDDFILNICGVVLFVWIVNKFSIIEKVKKYFYQDFSMPKAIKYGIWIVLLSFIMLFNIIMLTNIVMVEQIIQQTFYVEETKECNTLKKIELDDYNVYLDCVNVTYETEDNYQIPIEKALQKKQLTKKGIKKKLKLKDIIKDTTSIYSDKEENITMILCNSPSGNQDIYIGNKDMKYEKNYCQ